mmetsp:Transcript_18887/g.32745  ORF Transcript_18887/g.32745 Transcript_18887/m.32745 type:complete len:149 (+) Transcript_18887:224-670(+)|eukprot:CAMPEP_0184699990 /NCGR_PEP_ID=MMETSP0313-20130426/7209_1 /TAXON_ID=2792 /ORGANISM="Porphyridium aerugineum, Strain SAG 1380-2" /LENGTH=148 /DNA_ID=CAMNT_0027159273 /DNA_START=202 /DNA_END=648 /DNA_ORIENTATION=+
MMRHRGGEEEEEVEFEEEEDVEDHPPPKAAAKKRATQEEDGDEEEESQPKKKAAAGSGSKPAVVAKKGAAGKLKRNAEGELFVPLSKGKRITVRVFNNRVGVDIREFYENNGKQMPGKKGIWLTEEDFNAILANIAELRDAVDNALHK